MRRLLMTMMAFTLPVSFAHAVKFQVLDLNLNYQNGAGAVNTSKVMFDNQDVNVDAVDYDFNIEKVNDDLQFKNYSTGIRIKKFEEKLSLIRDMEELNISNAGVTYTDKVFITLENLFTNFGRNQFNINELTLVCEKIDQDPLNECFQHAGIEVGNITLPNLFSDILYEELLTTEPEENRLKAQTSYRPRIKNVKVSIKENDFVGQATVKMLFNVRFNIYGKLLLDSEKNELIIKNFTVKKGFIPITRVVLLALKRMKIESIRILGNSIYIKI